MFSNYSRWITIFLILFSAESCYAEVVADKDCYTVKDVCIEVFNIDPTNIRSDALQQGKDHATALLLDYIRRTEVKLSNEQIDRIVDEYNIVEETIFKDQKYKLCLNVIFNRNLLRSVLINYDIEQKDLEIYGKNKVNAIFLTSGRFGNWIELEKILLKNNIKYILKYFDYNKVVVMFEQVSPDKLIERIDKTGDLALVKNGNEYFLTRL